MISKNYGNIFWITGLSGSGKSSIGEKLKILLNKKYGKTIIIHGDDIRNIFQIRYYSKKKRLELAKYYSNFCKLINQQGINIIFTTVGLFSEVFEYNRKNLKNYTEIFIEADLKKLKKNKAKTFYKKKTKNVWGLDLKPQYPKKPDIIIHNDFNKSINELAKIIYNEINKNDL
jgi:adenylylsulfate kinase-like enzyme